MNRLILTLHLIVRLARLAASLIFIAALAAFVSAAASYRPFLLWSYDYYETGDGERHYERCTYLGLHGFVTPPVAYGRCPWVTLLETGQGGAS